MFQLFGFKFGSSRKEEAIQQNAVPTFAPPSNDDAAAVVGEGGVFGTTIDLDNSIKNEGALITKYREMALQSECDKAIEDIVNEAVIFDDDDVCVQLDVDEVEEIPDEIKEIMSEEFEEILSLLRFSATGYDIFRNWYVDGRLYYHLMIDVKNPRAGIQEIRYVDPRRIKKIRALKRNNGMIAPDLQGNILVNKKYEEYYMYSDKGLGPSNIGIKIAPDSIAYCHSGILNQNNTMVLSHLHKAIKPLNQLRMLEDATVISRLVRAPSRRVFYVDVGNLPKPKAEQYLREMMQKHKNKLVYDANTGEIRDDRKFMTMLEDYWLPRREGNRGTEISNIEGSANLGQLDDVNYFKKKMYESLHVPPSRMETEAAFNVGRASEITRDEVKFAKFIDRLRKRFVELFLILLEKQLVLKGVMTKEDWAEIKEKVKFTFAEDNHFAEMKEIEVMRERLSILAEVDPYVGKYFSRAYVRKKIIRQTDEEIKEIDKEMEQEPDVEMQEIEIAQMEAQLQAAEADAAMAKSMKSPAKKAKSNKK